MQTKILLLIAKDNKYFKNIIGQIKKIVKYKNIIKKVLLFF